jgi:hypothetical protein
MKKILMLVMLGYVISFGAYAGSGINKVKVNELVKKSEEEINKKQLKISQELCLTTFVFFETCPDGSAYIETVASVFADCHTGNIAIMWIDFVSTSNENC